MVSERIILPKPETETERPGEGITVKKKGGGQWRERKRDKKLQMCWKDSVGRDRGR